MKIFNWFQSKINGKQGTNKQNSVTVTNHRLHQPCRDEFSNWPIELLAIGTFGNNSLKDSMNLNQPDPPEEFTPEEVGELHKELTLLLCEQSPPSSDSAKDSTKDLEKFYECLQNLEDDRSTDEQVPECSGYKESHLKQSNSVVCGNGQEVKLENTSSGIGKKTLSYLLKKAFLRRGGFTSHTPPPLLRDPILQSKFEKLSLEKILRTILHKKAFPQASSPRANMKKKYLDYGNVLESDSEDEAFDRMKDKNKWDNSDSDFIVLEI